MTTADPPVPGLTVFAESLTTSHPRDGDTPRIERLFAGAGATVVRLSFTAGQRMDDHRAAAPILLQIHSGEVEFGVGAEVVLLSPGSALHLEGGITHRVVARTDSVVSLIVLR